MKLILKHLNIKSLMLSPTTSTTNADDIEHHADNAKYWLSWRTLHVYFDFINFLTALDVFFFFFFNFSYEYALLSYILFWYFLQVLKLHIIIHFVYGYICYWVSMLSRIFLVWVSPLFIKFSVLIDIKASILNLLNMNWILIWMFHAIIPMTLIV